MLLSLPCKLCIFTEHEVVYYHFAHWVNAWKTSGQPRINGFNYRVENVIKQLVLSQQCVHQDMKHLGSLESTQESYASFMLSKLPVCFISQ